MTSSRHCPVCGGPVAARRRRHGGRPATYCSDACRQRAFRRRAGNRSDDGERPLPPGSALLPALDGFVGRQAALRHLRHVLSTSRLVTLTGLPGVGKSRLAAEIARALRGPAHLITLATALATSTTDRLVDTIGDRRLLLVLDDCDHHRPTSARLAARVLRGCPGTRVLATCRRPLAATGEAVFRVAPLTPPASDDRASVLRSTAVRLFVDRAHASDPSFELTDDNAGSVADICRRLDGIPLAIELAARCIGVLTPCQLLAELDHPLTVLTAGARTGPDRHRDLRSAIAWSHPLLSEPERAAFRRLAVLPAGFDLAAATAVCAIDDTPAVVAALADRSFLVVRDDRYRQPHIVRAYAAEQLAAVGESDATWHRAAEWLAGVAEPTTHSVYLHDPTLDRLRRERDNLAAAIDHAGGDDQRILLATALARVWQEDDLAPAGRRMLTDALTRAPRSAYRADAMATIAEIACRQGDLHEALLSASTAVRDARALARPIGLAKALHVLAFTRLCRGEDAAAVTAEQECLDIVEAIGDDADIALVRCNLAWQYLRAGKDADAELLLRGGPPVTELPRAHAAAMHTIGMLRLARGDVAGAAESFTEGLARTAPESLDGAPLMEGLAIIAVRRGDAERALCLAASATAVRSRLGVVASADWRRQVEQALASARRATEPARVVTAVAAGERLRGAMLRAYALGQLTAPPEEIARRPECERLLTDREQEIVTLVADGLTNREIAACLRLSVSTVRTAVTALLNKLYLRSRIQLAMWAATRGVS